MSKIVFTNGCFDVIHRGHIELFKFCKQHGDILIIGLNSDSSVSILKGKSRPINNQDDRKEMLMSIRYIDRIIIFDELTPHKLIETVKPDVLVKGGDYDVNVTDINDKKYIVGKDIVKETIVFPYICGYSSTNILSRI